MISVSALAEPSPSVTVVVTPNPVTEGQSVQLRIEVEAAQSSVIFQPTFSAPDFILVGSQPLYGGAPITKFMGGRDVPMRKAFFEFVLSPKKEGNLFIRNIKAKVGTKEVSSPDQMVKVIPDRSAAPVSPLPGRPTAPVDDNDDEDSNPAAPGYGGGNAGGVIQSAPDEQPDSFNSDFTVFASVNKRKAYVGEPIVAEYWLYDFGDLQQVEVQKWPTFNGFWKDDLEITSRFEFEEAYVKNKVMRRAFIGRYALFGIKPGKISTDKLVIKGQYLSNPISQGFFQMRQLRTGTHGSQDVTIEILPLPTEGKPENFSGGVGQFFLKVEADKTEVPQHTPVTFTITLQGTGNFQAIDSIKLDLPPEFEVYDSNTAARGSNPIGVRRELETYKTFQVVAVPRKAGTFTIQPIQWSYFDPQRASYQKAVSHPLEIRVGEAAAGSQGAGNTYATKGAPPSEREKLAPLKEVSSKAPGAGSRFWLWIAIGLAALTNGWLIFGFIKRRAGAVVGAAFLDRFAEAKSELSRAKKEKEAAWLTALEDSIYSTAQVLLGSNPRGITRSELEYLWKERGLPAPLVNRISLLLDRLDQNRFSSAKKSENQLQLKEGMLREAEDILKEASKIKRR